MSDIVLSVENLWKQYRLGLVGSGTIKEDLARWWAKIRGKEDPTLRIGNTNDRQTIEGQYVWALQDINFDVKQGEVVGVIGKNGAGKSTLLKILSKVTSPTKGYIKTKGRIASLLEVGTGFHPELTGRENIFLNGAILGMHKNEIVAKFDEIVDFSGIGKYIDTPVKRYSSGMYVRLAFAVAAHLEPEILIVDEVLAVGDSEFQKKCLGKMKDVSGQGRTVLFVSHSMPSIQELCNSIVFVEKGKVTMHTKDVKRAINHYLSNGADSGDSTAEWIDLEGKRCKNEIHNITRFALTDHEGALLGNTITYNTDIHISIELEIFDEQKNLNVGYTLYDSQHSPIFWSWYKTDDTIGITALPKGKHRLVTVIPKKYLNQGSYTLELTSVLHNVKMLVGVSAGPSLSFEIEGGYPSVILNPSFVWQEARN
jgi:lipopolysaccharide transport system ATP-binding protein